MYLYFLFTCQRRLTWRWSEVRNVKNRCTYNNIIIIRPIPFALARLRFMCASTRYYDFLISKNPPVKNGRQIKLV